MNSVRRSNWNWLILKGHSTRGRLWWLHFVWLVIEALWSWQKGSPFGHFNVCWDCVTKPFIHEALQVLKVRSWNLFILSINGLKKFRQFFSCKSGIKLNKVFRGFRGNPNVEKGKRFDLKAKIRGKCLTQLRQKVSHLLSEFPHTSEDLFWCW